MKARDRSISEAVASIEISAIKEMAMRSARIPDAAQLTWGLPSFSTPAHIREIVERELEKDPDIGKYALPDGLRVLRELVCDNHHDATGVRVDPDDNVVVTAGNMQGINALLHAIIDPGDEVVVTDPGFASHFQQIRLCRGVPVFWTMDEKRNWALDLAALPALLTERTKAILLVTPSNPTGKIFTETELRQIGQIALERGILIILDDPYCHFAYENHSRYFNLSSVRELSSQLAYLFSFSKTYAMSGWRLGYMIAPAELKRQVLKVHDATIICAPRISQVAGIAALSTPPTHLREFESRLAKRRDLICARLDAVPHVFRYTKPEGAYYVFPEIVGSSLDSRSFAIDLLESAHVSVTPGAAFGPSGEHHVRMAYCVDEDTINLAFDRIEARFR